MAFQSGGRPSKGENVADPTRASKPAEPTYRYPHERGTIATLKPKYDDSGEALPRTEFARNQYAGPSSVGVKDSANMSDFDISPPDGDPVLKTLQAGGFGDQSGNGPVADLERKIATDQNVPVAFGMHKAASAGTIPQKLGAHDEENPVRQPS